MIAALLPRPAARCRSRQFALTFSLPPVNHLANGSFHSSTLFHFLTQASDSACSAQNRSGSSLARFQSASYSARLFTCALAENSGVGAKLRVSFRTLVISAAGEEDIAAGSGGGRALINVEGNCKPGRELSQPRAANRSERAIKLSQRAGFARLAQEKRQPGR